MPWCSWDELPRIPTYKVSWCCTRVNGQYYSSLVTESKSSSSMVKLDFYTLSMFICRELRKIFCWLQSTKLLKYPQHVPNKQFWQLIVTKCMHLCGIHRNHLFSDFFFKLKFGSSTSVFFLNVRWWNRFNLVLVKHDTKQMQQLETMVLVSRWHSKTLCHYTLIMSGILACIMST